MACELPERRSVENQALHLGRVHAHRELRGPLAQQRALPEVLRGLQARQDFLIGTSIGALGHDALTAGDDVPSLLLLSLMDEHIPLLELGGQEILRDLDLFLHQQALEQVHLANLLHHALDLCLLEAAHDAPELRLADAPDDGVLASDRRGRAWGVVEQRQLAEALTPAADSEHLRVPAIGFFLVALAERPLRQRHGPTQEFRVRCEVRHLLSVAVSGSEARSTCAGLERRPIRSGGVVRRVCLHRWRLLERRRRRDNARAVSRHADRGACRS
mmetsp:Transcript_8217/g.23470  ORF Transcript_8217/g.23470 Transcript_8217/m.23470 type:complete len:273 (-) Transcript_8217:1210-2028(-)